MGNTIANIKDSTLKHNTEYTQDEAAKRGKNPIISKEVTTIDVPTSEVVEDWEERNIKAVTERRTEVYASFNIPADMDLLGKVVGDLQKDVGASADNLVGTLHYVTGYTGFSGDPEEQEGHFLAFQVGYNGTYTKITAQGGSAPETEVDPSDYTHVMHVKAQKPLVIRAYNGDTVVSSKTYTTNQLKLEVEE